MENVDEEEVESIQGGDNEGEVESIRGGSNGSSDVTVDEKDTYKDTTSELGGVNNKITYVNPLFEFGIVNSGTVIKRKDLEKVKMADDNNVKT